MAKSKEVVQEMDKFQQMMFNLYEAAEGLRDCTEDGSEKEVFNKTRNALYELKYEARRLYHKWEAE